MCGISGAFAFTESGKVKFQYNQNANDKLTNRGPDGGKVKLFNNTTLGHRRLSIIDVSCAGDQPMATSDGRYTIVFNGEIFNFHELKTQLTPQELGNLRSTSDTEVFLVLYSRLKAKIFPMLRGFFAAAIYDEEENILTLVRDRFGKKPLLYYRDADHLCFASEMKALLAFNIPRKINWSVLSVYLQLNYIPQPFSMLEGVQKLEPGHFMTITQAAVTTSAYYTLNTNPQLYPSLTYEQAQSQFVSLMDESVRLRLLADVPLGAFLSGGIDSSVIVALASRHVKKLNTFSVGYKDNAFFDETKYAKLVAEKYKTEHTVFSLSNNDFLEHVHNIMNYIDEPFADSSAIPVFILSYYTRKHVTVALSGDGGDEIFAGYNKHAAEWKMRKGGLFAAAIAKGHPLWSALPRSRNNKLTNKFRQFHRFAAGSRLSAGNRYWQWASIITQEESLQLFHPMILENIKKEEVNRIKSLFTDNIKGDDFNEVLLADMKLILLSDMLPKVDLMSMANSLEIRSPFLDHKVVDFAFGLPSHYKIDGKMKKRIVQDSFRYYLPEELYNRPKKGFEIPLLGWFKKELWSLINDDLLSDRFVEEQQIFDVQEIKKLKKQLFSLNPEDSHATIWALLVFQRWWKTYIAI